MERLRRRPEGSYADRLVNRWTRIRRRIFSSSSSSSSLSLSSRVNNEDEVNANASQAASTDRQPRTCRDTECEALLREYEEAKKEHAEIRRLYEQEKEKFKKDMRKKIDRIHNDTNRMRERLTEMKSKNEESYDTISISSDSEATQILEGSETSDVDNVCDKDLNETSTALTKTQKLIAADWKLRAECYVKLERFVPKRKKPTIKNVQIIKSKFRINKDKLIKVNKADLQKLAITNFKNKNSGESTSASMKDNRRSDEELQGQNLSVEETKDDSEVKEIVPVSRDDKILYIKQEYYQCIEAIKMEKEGESEEYIAIEEIEIEEKDQDENNNRKSSLTQPVSKLAIVGVSLDSHDKPEGGMQPVCEALPDHDNQITPSKDEIEDLETLLAE